jgi:hypothetical protein
VLGLERDRGFALSRRDLRFQRVKTLSNSCIVLYNKSFRMSFGFVYLLS